MEWSKCLVPLVNSKKVKVLGRCVAAPINLQMMQEIMLYVRYKFHKILFALLFHLCVWFRTFPFVSCIKPAEKLLKRYLVKFKPGLTVWLCSFYIHQSVFREGDRSSWKLEPTNIDSTTYPLLTLFKLLKVKPFQKVPLASLSN